MDPGSSYQAAWERYRRLRRDCLMTLAANGVVAGFVVLLLQTSGDHPGVAVLTLMGLGLAVEVGLSVRFMSMVLRLRRFPCPACGKPFIGDGSRRNGFTKVCRNCSIRIGEATPQ
jgi:predicted RNA-binding Zn-ribbon protein involved in translation (DUF1610 family)